MEDEARSTSAYYIDLYSDYRAAIDRLPVRGEMMPYGWHQMPSGVSPIWMAYKLMLDGFALELANIVNALTLNINRLYAWAEVVKTLDDDGKLHASNEFIDSLGITALGQPYAIKSRFAYAAAQLCFEANKAKGLGHLKLPDKKSLYLNDIEEVCSPWKKFRKFKLKLEPVAGAKFNDGSDEFRHAYNHRQPVRILTGITQLVERQFPKMGGVRYTIGQRQPLDLSHIAQLLENECKICGAAFQAFQELVVEQIEAIGNT